MILTRNTVNELHWITVVNAGKLPPTKLPIHQIQAANRWNPQIFRLLKFIPVIFVLTTKKKINKRRIKFLSSFNFFSFPPRILWNSLDRNGHRRDPYHTSHNWFISDSATTTIRFVISVWISFVENVYFNHRDFCFGQDFLVERLLTRTARGVRCLWGRAWNASSRLSDAPQWIEHWCLLFGLWHRGDTLVIELKHLNMITIQRSETRYHRT